MTQQITLAELMSMVLPVPAGYKDKVVTEDAIREIISEQVDMIKAGYGILERANAFQMKAHDSIGQMRKYSNVPYWTHPQAVSNIVKDAGGDIYQQGAALLHDTIEDVYWIGLALIEALFFEGDTAAMVDGLTDVSRPEDGNRKIRKEIDRKHTVSQPARTQFVKLGDLEHNSESIIQFDKKFAKKYLPEKKAIIDTMLPEVRKTELGKKVIMGLKIHFAELELKY